MDDVGIESELEELSDSVVFAHSERDTLIALPADKKAEVWKRILGEVSPKQVCKTLSARCPDARIVLWPYQSQVGEVIIIQPDEAGVTRIRLESKAPFTESSALHLASFRVYGEQGAGTAKKAFLDVLTLLKTCFPNVKKITVLAIETGAYAWLKFGFVPNVPSTSDGPEAWVHGYGGWKEKIKTARHLIKDQLTRQENVVIDKVLESDDPKAAWMIADLPRVIHDPLGNKPVTLGKYCCKFNSWEGSLDLTEGSEGLARLKGYLAKLGEGRILSGKSTGEPARARG